jgi:hypothetical protein
MESREISREIWKNYNEIRDWDSTVFSVKKAYICSLLSMLSYEHIPEFELSQSSRIKLVPSETYWNKLLNGSSFNISNILPGMDFGEHFIIERSEIIIIGLRLKNTLFIVIRGTHKLNDWLVNLRIRKISIRQDKYMRVHSGFHKAVSECYDELIEKLHQYNSRNVYITGHSLGGAMAVILLNKLDVDNIYVRPYIKSCYTFGMPRLANSYAMERFISPFHFYNLNDIVPTLPPKWLGYQNCNLEYLLKDESFSEIHNRKGISIVKLIKIISSSGMKEHFISLYSHRLKVILQSPIN